MPSLNKFQVMGNLGQDPELRYSSSGSAVLNLSVATTSSWKDKNGDWQNNTQWHRITVWGDNAERLNTQIHKGSQIYAEGRIEYGSYEKNGNKIPTINLVAAVCFPTGSKEESKKSDEDIDDMLKGIM